MLYSAGDSANRSIHRLCGEDYLDRDTGICQVAGTGRAAIEPRATLKELLNKLFRDREMMSRKECRPIREGGFAPRF